MVRKSGRHSVRGQRLFAGGAATWQDVELSSYPAGGESDISPATTPLSWRRERKSKDAGLLGGTAKLVASNAGTNVLGLFSGIALARGLGPSGRGEYQTVVLIYTLVPAFCNLNIGTVIASTPLGSPLPVRSFRRLALWLVMLGSVAAGTAALGCGVGTPIVLVLISSSIGFMTSDVTQGILRRHSDFARVALMRWLDVGGSSLAMVVLFVLNVLNVTTAAVALVSTTVVAVLVGWWRARSMVAKEAARGEIERAQVGLVHASSSVRSFTSYIDQITVGAAVGASGLGQYALAANLARQMNIIPAALATVAFQMARRDESDDKDRGSFVLRMILLMSMVVGVAAWFGAPRIFRIVFGSGFEASGRVAAVLVVSVGLNGLLEVLETMLIGLGKPAVPLRCRLFALVTLLGTVPLLFHVRTPIAATVIAVSMAIVGVLSCLVLSGRSGGPSVHSVLVPQLRSDMKLITGFVKEFRK